VSFVEKNKAWLLPLLAVGVGGVLYLNLHTFSAPAPPVEAAPAESPAPIAPVSASQAPGSTPAPNPLAANPPPVAAASASAAEPSPDASGDSLWADLNRFAHVPDPLGQEADLKAQARNAVPKSRVETAGSLPLPARVSEPRPVAKAAGAKEDLLPEFAPDVDFLIHTSSGSRAWFQGREYRMGQGLKEGSYKVGSIAPYTVELKGPSGSVRRSTLDLPSGPKAPSPTEAP
jgi:hypothetical protein